MVPLLLKKLLEAFPDLNQEQTKKLVGLTEEICISVLKAAPNSQNRGSVNSISFTCEGCVLVSFPFWGSYNDGIFKKHDKCPFIL